MKRPELAGLTGSMNERLRGLFGGGSGPLILPGQDRRRAAKGTLVRNLSGKALPCCWRDCWSPGRTDQAVVVKHDAPERQGDTLTYVFCCPAHREHWLNELEPDRRALVVAGQRNPLGLIVP